MGEAVVNVNGRIVGQKDAVISAFDHGFLYGEGVYEVVRTYNGQPFLLDRHLERLHRSAEMIDFDPQLSSRELERRILETMTAVPDTPDDPVPREFYVRIILTRGVGELSYDPRACTSPTVLVLAKLLPPRPASHFAQGIKVALVSIVRNHPGTVNPLIKSNNLLNNAMAMQEALRKGAAEALMKNYRGELVECSLSNIFLVKRGVVRTPPLGAGLLAGITRAFVLELGREIGLPMEERSLREEDLLAADEVFLTGTTFEVTPVVQVDEQTVGGSKPGPITKRLLEAYRQRAQEMTRGAVPAR